MVNLNDTLASRGKTHGDFTDHARATQALKNVVMEERTRRVGRGQPDLNDCQCEAIDMILHKIGRILAGDPNEPDHWQDIAGYATIGGEDPQARKERLGLK